VSDDRTWSFRGGDWFGIFGTRATVVLPPTEKARVAALWELVDDGAGFDETLDALIAGGLRDLPGFVLVSRADDETRVVIRGAARAHFATPDDVVHVEGDSTTTWVERTIAGVSRMRIEVGDDPAPDDLVLDGGLVRLCSAECPPALDLGVRPGPGPDTEPDAGPDTGPDTGLDTGSDTGPPTEAVPASGGVHAASAGVDLDPDHDGLTRGGTDAPAYAPPPPGIPGQPPPPPVTARPVARLLLSSGGTVDVDRPVLVGRAPEAGRLSGPGETRLVPVPSPQQEISSTHLEVRPGSGADHGSAVVTDLGSTNGTVVVQPGLPPEDLRAGVAVQLLPGALIDLGDGVTIQVVNP
jgi:hypothetical protein